MTSVNIRLREELSEQIRALSELKDYGVYKEYCFLIDTIFNKYIDKENNDE